MPIAIVRLGSERRAGEGPRLGTVRRPPRGVPREQYAAENWFDVWLPNLAPSQELMSSFRANSEAGAWGVFSRRYAAEMKRPEASHLLDALALLSHTADFSVGCYCEDESRCHRSLLREQLTSRGAAIRSEP